MWDEPRPPRPPLRVWRDWALVAALVPLSVLEGVLRPDLPWRSLSMIVTVALVPTLLWRRSRPLLMVVIAFGVTALVPLVTGGAFQETYTMVYLLLLPYALVRWGPGREVVIGLAVILVNVCRTMVFDHPGATDVIGAFAVLFATVTLGLASRYRAGRGSASSTRSSCSNANSWPATCTTPSPITSPPWRSAPRRASRPRSHGRPPPPRRSA